MKATYTTKTANVQAAIEALKNLIANDRPSVDRILAKGAITHEPDISDENLFKFIMVKIRDGNNYLLFELLRLAQNVGYLNGDGEGTVLLEDDTTNESPDKGFNWGKAAETGGDIIGWLLSQKKDNSSTTTTGDDTSNSKADYMAYIEALKVWKVVFKGADTPDNRKRWIKIRNYIENFNSSNYQFEN